MRLGPILDVIGLVDLGLKQLQTCVWVVGGAIEMLLFLTLDVLLDLGLLSKTLENLVFLSLDWSLLFLSG